MNKRLLSLLLLAIFWPAAACADPAKSSTTHNWNVLTSLPLFMGEGSVEDILKAKSSQSDLITRLQVGRKLMPVDTLSSTVLTQSKLLFLLQPTILPSDELSAFDAWVRAGGRALILADPDMVWPTKHHLGGVGMPPPSTLLDSLFHYWGLELEGMRQNPKLAFGDIFGEQAALVNPGKWNIVKAGSDCTVQRSKLVAQCTLGKGTVILVADADIADPRLWSDSKTDNLPILAGLFSRLES